MAWLACPYLGMPVELTDERGDHIAAQHPDLLPIHRDALVRTVADPDQVRRSDRLTGARLLSRWFGDVAQGKHIVVVVITDPPPARRGWIITAYIARRLSGGTIEWTRN